MFCLRVLIFGALLATARGQITTFRVSRSEAPHRGVACDSFSFYAGLTEFPVLTAQLGGSDLSAGVGVQCRWDWSSRRTSVSVNYDGSYTTNYRNSQWDGSTADLLLTVTRRMTPRVKLSLTANAADIDPATALFTPSQAMRFGQTDFGSDTGQPGGANERMGSWSLSGPNGPLRTDRLIARGLRQRYIVVDATVAFAQSERMSWYGQLQSDYNSYPSSDNLAMSAAGVTRYAEMEADAGVQFAMSPRTQITSEIQSGREMFSSTGFLYSGASATLSHLIAPRWALQILAGVSSRQPLRHTQLPSSAFEFTPGGAMIYQGYAHTLAFSLSRQIGGGFGSSYPSGISTSAAWTWQKAGHPYTASAVVEWDHYGGVRGLPLDIALFGGGVGRRMNSTLSLVLQAVRSANTGISSEGTVGGAFPDTGVADFARGAIRISLVYTPQRHF